MNFWGVTLHPLTLPLADQLQIAVKLAVVGVFVLVWTIIKPLVQDIILLAASVD